MIRQKPRSQWKPGPKRTLRNAVALQHEIEQSDKLKRDQAIKDAAARGQTNAPPK